jgi:hypothetical protein
VKRVEFHPEELVLATVARTLRTVATQFMDDRGLMDLAEEVATQSTDSLAMCCPVCEETTCDEGCPLAEVRARLA